MIERTFKAVDRYGAELEFELREPDKTAITMSDMQYRIAYSIALKEGILPREKMREMFKETGIWDEEDEKNINSVVRDLALSEFKLENASKKGDKDECIKLAGEMAKHRIRMFQLFLVQHSCFMNSCEGYAEVVRLEALMAGSVFVKATGHRYWPTYKDYVIERDQNDKSTVVSKAADVNNSLLEAKKDELVAQYPEQQWLKQIQAEILETATKQAREMIKDKVEEARNGGEVADKTN